MGNYGKVLFFECLKKILTEIRIYCANKLVFKVVITGRTPYQREVEVLFPRKPPAVTVFPLINQTLEEVDVEDCVQ